MNNNGYTMQYYISWSRRYLYLLLHILWRIVESYKLIERGTHTHTHTQQEIEEKLSIVNYFIVLII